MGVLDELLNQGETFSYDDASEHNFSVQRRFPVAMENIPRTTVIPQANAQNPMAFGTRSGVPMAKAQFDISIKRLPPIARDGGAGTAFNEDVQVIIFQSSQIKSHYKRSISYSGSATFLGVDGGNIINPVVSLPNYNFGGHRFIYQNAPDSYVPVLITCPQIDYTALVSALESDVIRINYVKYFVPSAADSIQFNKRFEFIETSQFGKKSNDNVPVLSNIKSTDFKDRLIEIPVNFFVDKTKGLLLDIAPELENKEIVLSLFVDYTNRQSV